MGVDHLLALADFHVGVDFVKVPHQSQRNREQPHLGRSWALWITTASNAPLKSPLITTHFDLGQVRLGTASNAIYTVGELDTEFFGKIQQ